MYSALAASDSDPGQGLDVPAGQLSRRVVVPQSLSVEAMASDQRPMFERMAASSSSDDDSGTAKKVTASAPVFGMHVNCWPRGGALASPAHPCPFGVP